MAIDIGADAINRGETFVGGNTIINEGNPANASGTITSVEIWAYSDITGMKVATFYKTNGNTLKCRAVVEIGNVTSGSKQTFPVTLAVEAGDCLGAHWDANRIERDSGGYTGCWWLLGVDNCVVGAEAEYGHYAGDAISLYGTGDTPGIETLSPNAAGDECNIPAEVGAACPNHYQNVDDVIPDEDTTKVMRQYGDGGAAWCRDLYNLPASTGSGTIIKVTIYARVTTGALSASLGKIAIKTEATVYEYAMPDYGSGDGWVTFSQELTTNPNTGQAWTWTQIDALQAGISLSSAGFYTNNCTQVYVGVNYALIVAPTVTTQAATNVEPTTATLNGNITDTGGENCTERGFAYSLEDPVSWMYVYDTGSFGTGAFSEGIADLLPNREYVFRAYATNSGGTGWGSPLLFTTDPINITVSPPSATGVGVGVIPTIIIENPVHITISPPKANGAGSAFVPSITTEVSVTVSSPRALGDAIAFPPIVTVVRGVTIFSPLAVGNGSGIPAEIITQVCVDISPPFASGISIGITPIITTEQNITISPPSADGEGITFPPAVIISTTISCPVAVGTGEALSPIITLGISVITQPISALGVGVGSLVVVSVVFLRILRIHTEITTAQDLNLEATLTQALNIKSALAKGGIIEAVFKGG